MDPESAIPSSRWIASLNVRTGYRLFARRVEHYILGSLRQEPIDLVWIDAGPQLSPGFYRQLKQRGLPIINYNLDDPFGHRDYRKWDLYKKSVRYHDVTVVVRRENIQEALVAGAHKVRHVYRSYDPRAHAPIPFSGMERQKWASDIAFIGTWMPERGPFMSKLIDAGLPIKIYGDRWYKAREWKKLRPYVRIGSVYGDDYVHAIQYAKVALGLLSIGNRDLHTQRSAEIPFIGGAVFCAERTREHEAIYKDGSEAVFWSNPDECVAKCKELLENSEMRKALVQNGRQRVTALGLSNDNVVGAILDSFTRDDQILSWKLEEGSFARFSMDH